MSHSEMERIATELAQELINTAIYSYTKTLPVTRTGVSTDEEIIVFVYRASSSSSSTKTIKETIKSFPVATKPSGDVCPRCSGTGRV